MMQSQPSAGLSMIDTEAARVCFGERLADWPDARLAYLFGSRARGSERPNSDFDIAVLMADAAVRDAGGVNRSIRRLGARLADPVPAERLHIVLLNGAPPLLRHRVLRDGLLLCERDANERLRFSIRTIREHQDMEPRRREMRRLSHARQREGRTHGGSGDALAAARRPLAASLARVATLGELDEATFLAEAAVYDLADRYLHLAAEAAIDVANHWISDTGLRTPETNRDTFSVLEEAGEISSDLAERLRGWASFRNVLVHQYANIDHRISYRAIRDDLNDLHEFRRWALAKVEGG